MSATGGERHREREEEAKRDSAVCELVDGVESVSEIFFARENFCFFFGVLF